jgi:hypothetical protein
MIDAKSGLPGLAVVPATGLAGLAGLAGLTDPRDVLVAKYLERRVGLSSEEAAKLVNEQGWWCLYQAQRHRGGEARAFLEDLIPGYSDEVYGKLGVYLDGLRAKRACAMRNEEIKALVDACSAVRGFDRFRINGYAWPLVEEKLLDAKVTIEILLALIASAKDVMGVFGPDELEELSCLLGPRVNVAGMLEHVASIHSAESVESIEPVEAVESDGQEGQEGPGGREGQEGSEGQAVREEPRQEPREETREEPHEEPVPGTPPPVAVQAVMPGKPKDREDREDRERGGAKKRRLFPNDDASL